MFSVLSAQAGLSKLEAISMIETCDRDWIVGKAGEVSRYQIMPSVWRHYTSSRDFRNPVVASKVAAQHIDVLENTFRARTGREATHFDLYVMWNAGPTYYAKIGFNASRVATVIRERAARYANLRDMRNTPLLVANTR